MHCPIDMPQRASKPSKRLHDGEFRLLADLRYEWRCFQFFSGQAARKAGVTPQQHQALLSIRAAPDATQTVGELAKRLLIKPNSASELASRLEEQGLLERKGGPDGRLVSLRLTRKAEDLLATLSLAHLAELERMRPLLKTLVDRLEPQPDGPKPATPGSN